LRAVLFEPDPREFNHLRTSAPDNHIVLNTALSDVSGEIDFCLCRKQQNSSVYRPNFQLLNKFPDSERFEIIRTIKLTADTLDNQLRLNNIPQIDFIKIDAQGHELAILRGAMNTLGEVIGLELEVEFIPIYENQPLFSDVNYFVTKLGFDLLDIKRYYWKRKDIKNYGNDRKGQIVFADALFIRSPENILSFSNITETKVINSIRVYLAYGYFDLAEIFSRMANENGLLSNDQLNKVNLLLETCKSRVLIPDFRGKGRIRNFLIRIADIFSVGGWFSGGDNKLGNI
jgi:FkbM family methyltransferase